VTETVAFQDIKPIIGKTAADATFIYSHRGSPPLLNHIHLSAEGLVLVGAKGKALRVVVPATDGNLSATRRLAESAKSDAGQD
jgi:hypothetical protein